MVALPSEIDGKTVNSIGSCFMENETVTEVIIPDTIITIDIWTFRGAKNLTTISGGENVEKIGWQAFAGCSSLKNLPQFPKLTEIDLNAFEVCSSLENIPDAPNLKIIGEYSFAYCDNIKKLDFPESLEIIGRGAFLENSNLQEVNIPEGVTEIGTAAFKDTPWLAAMGANPVVHDGFLLACEGGKAEIWIPEDAKYIRSYLVKYGDGKVEKIYIPDSVKNIEDTGLDYFYDVTVYIPSSVEYIGEFDGSKSPSSNDLWFVVEEGSYAEEYAQTYNIQYEVVDDVQKIYESALEAYQSNHDSEESQ